MRIIDNITLALNYLFMKLVVIEVPHLFARVVVAGRAVILHQQVFLTVHHIDNSKGKIKVGL
jgi:hypothetical protein